MGPEHASENNENPQTTRWLSLLSFMTPSQAPYLAAAIIFAILSGILPPALAVLLGKIFDQFTSFGSGELSEHNYKLGITKYCMLLSILGSASWLLNALFFVLWRTFGDIQARSCRDKVFHSLLDKPIEWYDLRKLGTAVLLSRTQTLIHELHMATSQPLGYIVQYGSTAVAALCLALYLSWDLTLVTLAALPISAVVLGFISRRMQPSITGQTEQLAVASKCAINAFNNIETVKCFNGQENEIQSFACAIRNAAKYYRQQAKINAFQIGFIRFMTLCMFVQGFWYGSHLVLSGKKSAGTVITTFWACLQATQTVEQTFPQMLVLEKGRAAGHALRELFANNSKATAHAKAGTGRVIPGSCSGDIEFRDVSFAYPTRPGRMVLSNVSLFFAAGETTFIVGHSGSGKSTLGQLLVKFYEPSSGSLLLDGFDLSNVDTRWLRSNITLVEQQSAIFQGSILENINLARRIMPKVDMEDVEEAIQFSMLSDTIKNMPNKSSTYVGPRGSSLSGGQRQRVELARARLRDSPVLILDESTSALDHVTRSLVMSAVRRWRRGKTTLIISHDMSQITEEDFVYVMKDGSVAQEGFASSLKEDINCPLYRLLSKDQRQAHESNDMSVSASTGSGHEKSGQTRPYSVYSSSTFVTAEEISAPKLKPASMSPIRHDLADNYTPEAKISLTDNGQASRYPESSGLSPSVRPEFSATPLSESDPISDYFSTQKPLLETLPHKGIELMELRGRNTSAKRASTTLSVPNSQLRLFSAESTTTNCIHSSYNIARPEDRPSMSTIFKTIWPTLNSRSRVVLIVGFCSAFANAVATPVFAWTFSQLLETFYLREKRSQEALKWSMCIFAIALFNAVALFVKHFALEHCGQFWVDAIRCEAMTRVIYQPKEFFTEKENSTSSIAQALDRDAEEMRNLLGRFAAYGFVAIIMMSVSIAWSLIVCWRLALVALGTAPFVYAFTKSFDIVNARLESKTNDAAEEAGFVMSEAFTNVKTLRALTLEDHFQRRHSSATLKTLQFGLRRALYSSIFFGISDSVVLFIQALVFYYGAFLTWSGAASVQDILLVFSLLLFTLASVNAIVTFIPQIGSSRDTAFRLLRLSKLSRISHEDEGSSRVSVIGDVILKNLTYRYQSRPTVTVLNGVSLKFTKGSTTAIVGSSGSGKSTIASLLLRLYPTISKTPAAAPQISIDRRDISRIHTPTLRNLVSIVPQTPVMFPGTIAQNITYGLSISSPNRTEINIHSAAKAAGIHEFILSLPYGYQTLIGDGGTNLSGGEAQRIAVARALIRRPNVLILDEATSALDAESATQVRKSIQKLVERSSDMTVLIITHHEDMMEIADKVVMLDHGNVIEEGTFKELSENNGPFAKLLRAGEWKLEGSGRTLMKPDSRTKSN